VAEDVVRILRALASQRRLQILEWLKAPRAHFSPQTDGDLVRDGVCALALAEKMGISHPTLGEHMKMLCQADLVISTRVKNWRFYRRNEPGIERAKSLIQERL